MAIPTCDGFLLPFLALLASGPPLHTREVERQIQASSGLTADELAQRPRPDRVITVQTAIALARRCLSDAGLIERLPHGQYQISESGRAFLAAHPTTISRQMILETPGMKARRDERRRRAEGDEASARSAAAELLETLQEALKRQEQELRVLVSAASLRKGPENSATPDAVAGGRMRRAHSQEMREVAELIEGLESRLTQLQIAVARSRCDVQEQFVAYHRLCHTEPPLSPADVEAHFDDFQQRLPLMKKQALRLRESQAELLLQLEKEIAVRRKQDSLKRNLFSLEQLNRAMRGSAPLEPAQAQNRPAIFISYSSKDEAIAAELCRVVEQAKFPCWYSGRDLKPGKAAYPIRITEAIDKSWIVVVLLSEDSLKSQFVANELDHATGAKKGFLPIVVKDFRGELTPEFKFHLGRYQRLKFPLADAELIKTVERLWDEHAKKQH